MLEFFATNFVAEEKVSGISLFLPQPFEIFWSVIVVLIIVIAFYKFILPKFNKTLGERSEAIEGNIVDAANKNKEAEAKLNEYNTKLAQAKTESLNIIDNANNYLEQTKIEATKEAEKIANQKIENADRVIDEYTKNAEKTLKNSTVEIAAQIAEKMLRSQLKDKKQQDLSIEDFIESVN